MSSSARRSSIRLYNEESNDDFLMVSAFSFMSTMSQIPEYHGLVKGCARALDWKILGGHV
jgi:hypothetical protein